MPRMMQSAVPENHEQHSLAEQHMCPTRQLAGTTGAGLLHLRMCYERRLGAFAPQSKAPSYAVVQQHMPCMQQHPAGPDQSGADSSAQTIFAQTESLRELHRHFEPPAGIDWHHAHHQVRRVAPSPVPRIRQICGTLKTYNGQRNGPPAVGRSIARALHASTRSATYCGAFSRHLHMMSLSG